LTAFSCGELVSTSPENAYRSRQIRFRNARWAGAPYDQSRILAF
jgi:hypothetical protein